MAQAPKTTDQGIQADVPPESGHLPGAVDPDSSEPQIPRVASATVGPGDVASTLPGALVAGAGRAADGRADPKAGGTGRTSTDPDGRPIIAQPLQQQQAQAAGPGPGQEEGIEGPGYPTEDLDDVDNEDDDEDDDEDEEAVPDDEEVEGRASIDDDVQATAPPELGDAPIEAEDGDTSIVGDGHADKAAWNRERIAAMQDTEEEAHGADTFGSQAVLGHGGSPDTNRAGLADEAQIASTGRRTPGSSEDMGYGGGAPNEDVTPDLPGLDTGDGRLDELAEETDIEEDDALGDAAGSLDDDTDADAGLPEGRRADGAPRLPESREFPDEGLSDEERILADDDEDGMFGDGGMGDEDDLEMEEMNEIDDIANDFEDQRIADDSMDGNEERTQRRD